MKEKKEFYMNFLKDDKYPFKYSEKKDMENGSSSNKKDNKNINLNKINISNEEPKKENYSFDKFASEIENYDFNKKTKWDNEARNYIINVENKENIIKLTELNQINYKNPLLLLNKEYLQEKYNHKLFEEELFNIESKINSNNNLFENNNTMIFIEKAIEEKEKLELYLKILKYYLDYYCINNTEIMNPPIDKIRQLTKITDFYYDQIHSKKKKILLMKRCNIDNAMKLILRKKKLENLIKIYSFLKYNISEIYNGYKELEIKKLNYDFIPYYNLNIKLIDETCKIEKRIFNILNKENNGMEKDIKKFNVMKLIKNELINKKELFNKKIHEEINNIFESKKSYIFHLYYLFDINQNKKENESFVDKIKNIFKMKSKVIILDSLQYIYDIQSNRKNVKFIYNFMNPKLSNINKIILNEKYLIIYFINILVKLKNLLDIFLYYYNSINSNNIEEKEYQNKYENFKSQIKSKKNEFYEILDKHISKTILLIEKSTLINDESKMVSNKSVLYILNLICIFEKLLKINFNVKYNKFINLSIKNYLIKKFKFENKKSLEKSIILLSNETWEKKLLDKSFFDIEHIKEKIPFYLKRFISFFNESEIKESWTSKLINKDNIDKIFNCIINNDEYNINDNIDIKYKNFDEIITININNKEKEIFTKEIENENNIIIFNEPLKYDKSFSTNSSFVIIKEIEEQIINIIIFESLIYDIFTNLFVNIDLYIFIIFKIFIQECKYQSNLFLNPNETDIDKESWNIDYLCNIIFFQKKFCELKKFCNSCENKISKFFEKEININSDNGNNNYYENLISNFSFNFENIKNKFDPKNIENGLNLNLSEKNMVSNEQELYNNKTGNNIGNINDDNKISNLKEQNIKNKNFYNFLYKIDNKNSRTKNNNSTTNELINDMKLKLSNINIKKIIILISSIRTIKKILKRLIFFTTKIELELERYEVLSKINNYEKLIEQIRNFFYLEISENIIDFSQISNIIQNYNWSPNPEQGSKELFEASDWVNNLINIFEVIISEIHNKLFETFGEKKLSEFISELINYIINCIQENLAKIKKCNDMGRSIMLKDIKLLKEGIDNILKKYELNKKIKVDKIFDSIIQFINSWYYNSDELYQYIFNYNIEYKYFENIFYSSPFISQLSSDVKNEFMKKVKQNYINKLKKVIACINKDT